MFRHMMIVALVIGSSITGLCVAQNPKAPAKAAAETFTGVLRGALSTHDQKTDWSAIVVGETRSYLIVVEGGSDDAFDKALKKWVGKRIAVRGVCMTEFKAPDGETMKLSGKLAGIPYDGNISLSSTKDVALQETTALTGKVEEFEVSPAKDKKPAEKALRVVTDGEKPTTYSVAPFAAKKLKPSIGKAVALKAYLNGARIDDVEVVTGTK